MLALSLEFVARAFTRQIKPVASANQCPTSLLSPPAMRTERDSTLGMPRLILPSIQVNMRAGRLPEPEANGSRYLKLPLNLL